MESMVEHMLKLKTATQHGRTSTMKMMILRVQKLAGEPMT
jgi:hypothetical protein